jgi:hypothetical protein
MGWDFACTVQGVLDGSGYGIKRSWVIIFGMG